MGRTQRRRPILIGICFHAYGSGLSRVMHTIMHGISDQYEIHYLGLGYSGPILRDRGVTIHPTNTEGGDVYAAFQARDLIEKLHPKIVFVLHDLWLFKNYQKVFEPVRHLSTFVGYIPLDGNIVHEEIVEPLHGFDMVALYTDWAKNEVVSAIERLPPSSRAWPRIEVVPHGVKVDDFYPIETAAAKQAVFPELGDPESSFIILNASCPSVRKRVDVTIDAFAQFAAGKPHNVKLCLHQAITEDETRQLVAYARETLGDRLIYNPLTRETGGAISESKLNLLYNACDIGVNTSAGEGWGLVSFEHAATGATQVVPDHSACGVLWNEDCSELVQPVRREIPLFSPLEMAFVDADSVAAAFEALYQDPSLRARKSETARRHATREEIQWSSVIERWRSLFSGI